MKKDRLVEIHVAKERAKMFPRDLAKYKATEALSHLEELMEMAENYRAMLRATDEFIDSIF